MKTIIKTQSYTENFPIDNCRVKVAIKIRNWKNNQSIKTEVYEEAIYEDGFVSIDGKDYYLAGNFLFHKLKRTNL